jgi:hypothetical protein
MSAIVRLCLVLARFTLVLVRFFVTSFGSLTTNSSVFIVDVTSDDDDETSALCSKLLVTVLDLFLFFNKLFDAFLLPFFVAFHLLAHNML